MSEQEVLASAIIYLRVSTKEQAQKGGEAEGYSIPAQRAACLRKAESLGAQVVAEFVDAGESAKTSARPQLRAMLERLSQGGIDYVIVHKVDRLARNRIDDVQINIAIAHAGARLVSVSESIDETPSGQLLHGVMSSVAEFFSNNLAHEVTKGMVQKLRAGGTVSMVPLGYLNVTHTVNGQVIKTVEIDPERAPLMLWAFEAYATGQYSLNNLVRLLEAKGLTFRPAFGKPARPVKMSQLHRLLRNRYYIGIVTWRGVEYPGNHTPLVSEELFNKVQAMLKHRCTNAERSYRSRHYLKGSLICGQCQAKVTFAVSTNQDGVKYPYFFCLGRHEKRTVCNLPYTAPHIVEKKIDRVYSTSPLRQKDMPELKRALLADLELYSKKSAHEGVRLKVRIKKLQDERYKWAEKAMDGTVPDDIARDKQALLAIQLKETQDRLQKESVEIDKARITIEKLCDLAERLHIAYKDGKPALRRTLNQIFFETFELRLTDTDVALSAQPTKIMEALQTAQIVKSEEGKMFAGALENEKKRRDSYGVFSFVSNSRVDTVVIPRGIEPRLPG